jgi:hypothetical protein
MNMQEITQDILRALIPEVGSVSLSNTKQYPFNDSEVIVALSAARASDSYTVQTELLSSDGEAGDVVVSGKALNGFKLAYTGSATSADIRYSVTGGY